MYNTTWPHLFWKIFVDFLTSTLLRAQNTTLLSKAWRRFFQILWPSQKTQTLILSVTSVKPEVLWFLNIAQIINALSTYQIFKFILVSSRLWGYYSRFFTIPLSDFSFFWEKLVKISVWYWLALFWSHLGQVRLEKWKSLFKCTLAVFQVNRTLASKSSCSVLFTKSRLPVIYQECFPTMAARASVVTLFFHGKWRNFFTQYLCTFLVEDGSKTYELCELE